MSAGTRRDWILWGALGFALVGTAHSEWSLAVSIGAHPWIAAAVPGALDLYVIRALQQRRDVLLAVLAMVAANIAWYLVHSGDLPVGWQLRSAVGAVAPLVVWRVHSLKYTRTRKELVWGLDAGAADAPVPEPSTPALTAPETDADWLPDFLAEQVHPGAVSAPEEYAHPAPVLPELPPEYVPSAAVPDEYGDDESALEPGDHAHLGGMRAYLATSAEAGEDPSIRGLMKFSSIGQERAKRLLKYAGVRS